MNSFDNIPQNISISVNVFALYRRYGEYIHNSLLDGYLPTNAFCHYQLEGCNIKGFWKVIAWHNNGANDMYFLIMEGRTTANKFLLNWDPVIYLGHGSAKGNRQSGDIYLISNRSANSWIKCNVLQWPESVWNVFSLWELGYQLYVSNIYICPCSVAVSSKVLFLRQVSEFMIEKFIHVRNQVQYH